MELWEYIYHRITKGFLYDSFTSLCGGCLGAAPIPYAHNAILNLPNLYIRSTVAVLLDKVLKEDVKVLYICQLLTV